MSAPEFTVPRAPAGLGRRPAVGLLRLACGLAFGLATLPSTQAATSLALGSASAGPGESAVVDIVFQADGNPVAVQFDIHFDAAKLTPGVAVAGAALTGSVVQSANPLPGVARVVIYSASNRPIGNGTIAKLPLRALAAAPGGATPVSVSNVVVSSTAGARLEPITTSGGSVTLRNESAPRFRHPILAVNGQITLTLEGQEGRSYTLQVSTDPSAGWQAAATAVVSGGVAVFLDTPTGGAGARFYRAVLVP